MEPSTTSALLLDCAVQLEILTNPSSSTKPPLPSLATHTATGSTTGAAASGTGKPGSSGTQNTFAVDSWVMILSGICTGGILFNGGL